MFDQNNNLKINSKIKDEYNVIFTENFQNQIIELIDEKDVLFIVDNSFYKLFSFDLIESLEKKKVLFIESGENAKTLDYIHKVIEKLITMNIKKNYIIVAIGGGVTQDIVAFISTILFRGIEWIFFPTTLLAQCDSCIGSKSSINFLNYKNLLGTFNPPKNIFIDLNFLETLSELDIKSGIGEMYHYFIPFNIEMAISLSSKYNDVLTNRKLLKYYILQSLKIKKTIIEVDEFDQNERHVFNYGHTFGHAIESITNYNIVHGQAVSIGMDLANFISLKLNLIEQNDFDKLHNILFQNIPEFKFNQKNIDAFIIALSKDKKNVEKKLGCILFDKTQSVRKHYIDIDEKLITWILSYSELSSI